MRKFLMCIAVMAFGLSALAQSAGSMFLNMPDTLLPYLNKAQRAELLGIKGLDPDEPAVVRNLLSADSKLLSVSQTRLVVKPGSGTQLELQRLMAENGDSVYCLLKTIAMPENETTACIYDKNWSKIRLLDFQEAELMQKPDTMTEAVYSELRALVEFPIVEAHFSDEPGEIVLTLNAPFLTKEDRHRLAAILVSRRMRWDGNTFNYSKDSK